MTARTLRKQLYIALLAVVVAVFAVTASTFAWFSANQRVTAQGMQVTARADNMFLQIKGTGGTADNGTIVADGNDFSTSGAVVMTDVKVYPTAHEALSVPADIEAVDALDATLTDNWYFGYSNATNVSTMVAETQSPVTAARFNYFVAEVTYQVRLNSNSGVTEVYDLYVKDVTLPADTGISAIVVGQNRFQEFKTSVADNEPTAVALSDTVTTTPQTVTVYLYIDGNNTNVKTDNVASLLGDVVLNLTCYAGDTL